MKFGGILGQTVAASAVLAAVAVAAGILTGRPAIGFGLGAGLLIGSFNGHALIALLDRHVPFVGAALIRMAMLSAVGILFAVVAGATPWAVLLGVAGAQLVLTATAIRQGLKA